MPGPAGDSLVLPDRLMAVLPFLLRTGQFKAVPLTQSATHRSAYSHGGKTPRSAPRGRCLAKFPFHSRKESAGRISHQHSGACAVWEITTQLICERSTAIQNFRRVKHDGLCPRSFGYDEPTPVALITPKRHQKKPTTSGAQPRRRTRLGLEVAFADMRSPGLPSS